MSSISNANNVLMVEPLRNKSFSELEQLKLPKSLLIDENEYEFNNQVMISDLEQSVDSKDLESTEMYQNVIDSYDKLLSTEQDQLTSDGISIIRNQIDEILNQKDITPELISTIKEFDSNLVELKSELPNLSPQLKQVQQSSTITPNALFVDNTSEVLPYQKVKHFFGDFDWGFLNTCDVPTRMAYVMLYLAKCPITEALKELSGEFIQQGAYSQYVMDVSQEFAPINQFFENNSEATVNVFQAFSYWMYYNHPGSYSPQQPPEISSVEQAFSESCPALFESMYSSLISYNNSNPDSIITSEMLANGDTAIYSQNSQTNPSINQVSQQVFMSYLVYSPNKIAKDITLDPNAEIFDSDWTSASGSVVGNTSQLYQSVTSDGETTYNFTFNSLNVAANIGSKSTSTGVLHSCETLSNVALRSQTSISTCQGYYGNLFGNVMSSGISAVKQLSFSWLSNFY